jgi:small subunit ribosomal protein S1
MVHLSDLDWELSGEEAVKKYNKGDVVRAQILDVDVEKERISLGVKQLQEDPFKQAIAGIKRGDRVTCTVKEVTPGGIEVETSSGATGFIRKAELSRDRDEQRPERYAPGEKVDAKVMNLDALNRRLGLSIKALEIEDEKQAMAEYGSSDSGASLGEILGAAFRQKQEAEQNKG